MVRVEASPGGDGSGLGVKLGVLLLEAQQVPQPLILPAGGLSLPGLGPELGVLLPELLQLLLHLLPLKGVGIEALRPLHQAVDPVAKGGGYHPRQVGKGIGNAAEGKGQHCGDQR